MSESEETIGRSGRWVAMWQVAVGAGRSAMALVDLSTTRFLGVSPRFAELLGTTPEGGAGLDHLSVTDRSADVAQAYRLAREGVLTGVRLQDRFRRPDGSTVEVSVSGWVIRSTVGPDLGLMVAETTLDGAVDGAVVADEGIAATPDRSSGFEFGDAQITLDHQWRMSFIRTGSRLLLGRPPAGLVAHSLIELTHPDDVAPLLFAFARATSRNSVWVQVRLRHDDGNWRTCQLRPTLSDDDASTPFGFDLVIDEGVVMPGDEVGRLAENLRRIAARIEAAGVLVEMANPAGVPAMTKLSPREWEVFSRLVRGERVSAIATELYLSPSTVRNHLTAIFRKAGVHSQHELIVRWRGSAKALSL